MRCHRENTKETYVRNTTYETQLQTYIDQGEKQINDILRQNRELVSKEKSKNYKRFLKLTTQKMMEQSHTFQLSVNNPDHTLSIVSSSIENISKTSVVNIISFEKSLDYILKYIAYHFSQGKNSFIIFCDEFNFNELIKTTSIYEKENYENENEKENKRQPLLTEQLKIDGYTLSSKELSFLRSLNIYIVYSNHCLMTGVGGKRSLIQYYNYLLAKDDDNYTCLTIDDNISGVFEVNLTECKRRNVLQNKHYNEEKFANCKSVLLTDIYDELANKTKGDILFSGIDKGDATADNAGIQDIHSNTIYKLNVSRPVKLFERNLFYNPYFTSFFEDITFNAELDASSCLKLPKYFLRFAHFHSNHSKKETDKCISIEDHNDTFPSNIQKSFQSPKIEPVYLMYILYFSQQYHNKNIDIHMGQSKNAYTLPYFTLYKSPWLQLGGKYKCYQMPFYILCVLFFYGNNTKIQLCENGHIKEANYGTVYYSLFDVLMEERKNGKTIEYNIKASIPLELIRFTRLTDLCNGEKIIETALLKEKREQITPVVVNEQYAKNSTNKFEIISEKRVRNSQIQNIQTITKKRKREEISSKDKTKTTKTAKTKTTKTAKTKTTKTKKRQISHRKTVYQI